MDTSTSMSGIQHALVLSLPTEIGFLLLQDEGQLNLDKIIEQQRMNLLREVRRRIFWDDSPIWALHSLDFFVFLVSRLGPKNSSCQSVIFPALDPGSAAKELALLVLELAFPPSSSCATVT